MACTIFCSVIAFTFPTKLGIWGQFSENVSGQGHQSQTCIKRSPSEQRNNGLIGQVTS